MSLCELNVPPPPQLGPPSGSGFLLICTPGIKDVHVTFVILQHEGQVQQHFGLTPREHA